MCLRNGAKLASEGELAAAGFLEGKLRPRARQHNIQECCIWSYPFLIPDPEKVLVDLPHGGYKPHPLLRPSPFSSFIDLTLGPTQLSARPIVVSRLRPPAAIGCPLRGPPKYPHIEGGPASLTDWLVLQETQVVQRLTLLGSQVLKPETNDALALLQGTGREYSE